MSATHAQCPSYAVLTDFGLGKLDAVSADTISQHLEACANCQQRVASISGDTFVERLREADAKGKHAPRRESAYVPGESLANVTKSADGSLAKDSRPTGSPSPSGTVDEREKRDGLGRSFSIVAPPELAKHPDYELIKQLGQGGMGTVYLAKNRLMDRLEVLKVVSKSLLGRSGAMERFQQEIRAAAKLSHPNIVAAYRVLQAGELLVFAMEYVAGRDLEKVVKGRGYLPVVNAALYTQQVALGLQHAFESGMVHRDIKPNNLMLAVEGKKHIVKILDFGLARANSEKDALTGLTKSGQMLGTPDYIAPEQILDARKADIRADIYSLGCTLYYLLSGWPPFKAESLYEVLEAHHNREPEPLNLLRPDVPLELASVVAKMMAKNPTRRFQTPGDVAKAITPFFKRGESAALRPMDAAQFVAPTHTTHGRDAATPDRSIPPPPIQMALPLIPAFEPTGPSTIILTNKSPNEKAGRSLPWIAIAAGAGALAIVLGVIVIIRNQKGHEVARAELQDGTSLEVRPSEAAPKITPPSAISQTEEDVVASKLPTGPAGGSPTQTAPPLAVAPFDANQARAHQEAWAKHLRLPIEQANSISMKLVLIPPGEFKMGTTEEQYEEMFRGLNSVGLLRTIHSVELPQHQVRITRPLLASVGEVTVGQFRRFVDAVGFQTEAERDHTGGSGFIPSATPPYYAQKPEFTWRNWGVEQDEEFPVLNVTWGDAIDFCNWLSKQENLPPAYRKEDDANQMSVLDRVGYRLPTEAEWEYMCRAGTSTAYHFGNDSLLAELTDMKARERLNTHVWWMGNSGRKPCSVLALPPNAFGLFGMHGNASEWCQDRFAADYYMTSPTDDPSGPASDTTGRVSRGGSWYDSNITIRSADRRDFLASYRGVQLGFRIVRLAAANSVSSTSPSLAAAEVTPIPGPLLAKPPLAVAEATLISGPAPANSPPPLAVAPFDANQARAHQEAWATHLRVRVEQTNSIGTKFILIPPGEFTMGSTLEQIAAAKELARQSDAKPDDRSLDNLQTELPAHRVTISSPFLVAATEVTVAQFRQFVEAANYVTETERLGGGQSTQQHETDLSKKELAWRSPGPAVFENSAVSQVTWNDAIAFCNWLSDAEQKSPCYRRDETEEWELSPEGNGYRLPTEAEWEFACRGGTTSQYSFADHPTDLLQYGGEVNPTRIVARKKPNPFGLYDMHGNLEEWCHDWRRGFYYQESPPVDPFGPLNSDTFSRVTRGGYVWPLPVLGYRSAFRRAHSPISRLSELGFRVVRVSTVFARRQGSGEDATNSK